MRSDGVALHRTHKLSGGPPPLSTNQAEAPPARRPLEHQVRPRYRAHRAANQLPATLSSSKHSMSGSVSYFFVMLGDMRQD